MGGGRAQWLARAGVSIDVGGWGGRQQGGDRGDGGGIEATGSRARLFSSRALLGFRLGKWAAGVGLGGGGGSGPGGSKKV
jgi:hypothetical protein